MNSRHQFTFIYRYLVASLQICARCVDIHSKRIYSGHNSLVAIVQYLVSRYAESLWCQAHALSTTQTRLPLRIIFVRLTHYISFHAGHDVSESFIAAPLYVPCNDMLHWEKISMIMSAQKCELGVTQNHPETPNRPNGHSCTKHMTTWCVSASVSDLSFAWWNVSLIDRV